MLIIYLIYALERKKKTISFQHFLFFSIQYKENIYEYQTKPSYHIHEGIYTRVHSRRHYAMQTYFFFLYY